MGIETQFDFVAFKESRFKEIDHLVMGVAYEIQNEFGRLFDEAVYQKELVDRIGRKLRCDAEVPIDVSYLSFAKTFRMDVVIERGLVCELKATRATSPEHEAQLLQYVLLSETSRGKLINFGTKSVEGNLVSTNLNHRRRRELAFDFSAWVEPNSGSENFKNLIVGLLKEWGGFLSLTLYHKAMTHLLGGAEHVVQRIDVLSGTKVVAIQKCHLLNPTTAFKLTALTKGTEGYEKQIQKFLSRTRLTTVQWVNLNHHKVEFRTINKN